MRLGDDFFVSSAAAEAGGGGGGIFLFRTTSFGFFVIGGGGPTGATPVSGGGGGGKARAPGSCDSGPSSASCSTSARVLMRASFSDTNLTRLTGNSPSCPASLRPTPHPS